MTAPLTGPAYRIHTMRLVIRCWNPADAPLLKVAIDASLEHLRPWMPWAEEARQVFRQLVELAYTLDDQDLHDPTRFAHMPADWAPWQIIAGNSFAHYRAHASDLRRWLDQPSQA